MATIKGTRRGELIFGNEGESDSIYAGAGDDHIYASPFDSLIDGGSGNDTLDFSLYRNLDERGVNARLAGGDLGVWPDQNGAEIHVNGRIKYVENLVGSIYNDALMGNGYVNKLDGYDGNDWLIAWGSGDFLTGGEGADKFALDHAGKKTTIIDFDFDEGDRLYFDFAPQVSWTRGTAVDASGQNQAAWVGTYLDRYGNTERVYLLGVSADTQPGTDWIIDLN